MGGQAWVGGQGWMGGQGWVGGQGWRGGQAGVGGQGWLGGQGWGGGGGGGGQGCSAGRAQQECIGSEHRTGSWGLRNAPKKGRQPGGSRQILGTRKAYLHQHAAAATSIAASTLFP